MARFYGVLQGQAGEATRLGSPRSGIKAQARGWNIGVRVEGYVAADGTDAFAVHLTGGSNGSTPSRLLGTVQTDENGEAVFVVSHKLRAVMDGANPVVMV